MFWCKSSRARRVDASDDGHTGRDVVSGEKQTIEEIHAQGREPPGAAMSIGVFCETFLSSKAVQMHASVDSMAQKVTGMQANVKNNEQGLISKRIVGLQLELQTLSKLVTDIQRILNQLDPAAPQTLTTLTLTNGSRTVGASCPHVPALQSPETRLPRSSGGAQSARANRGNNCSVSIGLPRPAWSARSARCSQSTQSAQSVHPARYTEAGARKGSHIGEHLVI